MDLNDFENQAIPHEAGHITVGMSAGFPIHGMSVIIFRETKGTLPGNFITDSKEPNSEAVVRLTPPHIIAAYKMMIGGGLAGNIVADVPAANECLQDDRRKLELVGNESLEEMAARGEPIIREHLEGFLKLVEAIGDRYLMLKNNLALGTGKYQLLTEQELRDLAGIDVPPLM
jgi:hypothetical protein